MTALLAYNDGDWRTAAENFEKSLELYFTEEERCRAGCERPFTHTGYPDFISAVAGKGKSKTGRSMFLRGMA